VLLVGHAAGLAAGAYLPLLTQLAGEADIFAFDARGHGGSAAPTGDLAIYNPDAYAQDIARLGRAVAARTGGAPIAYVAHSLNAACMLHLAAMHRTAFATVPWRSLLLFEPPVFPTRGRPEYDAIIAEDIRVTEAVRKRRRDWASPEAFADALTGRGVFRGVSRDYLLAYARACLRPMPNQDTRGGYTLACPPEIEAATFASVAKATTFDALPGLPAELTIHLVGGDPAVNKGWTTTFAPALARQLGAGATRGRRFTQIPGSGHFMLMQDPAAALVVIRGVISTN
jgi:pimeloyl-ACP methyl ester carboxylesterase